MRTKILTMLGSLCILSTMQAQDISYNVSAKEQIPVAMIEQSSKSDSLVVSHSEDHVDATKDTINSLVQKVASLERELAFQKLYNELYKLNTDMSIFRNTLNNTSNSLQINLNGRNLDFDLYKAYKNDLEVSKERIIIFQQSIEIQDANFNIQLLRYPFSKDEIDLLKASHRTLDSGFSALKASYNMYKTVLIAYRESL